MNNCCHPGFFGGTNHYEASGKKRGESRDGLFGSKTHYKK